MMRCSSGSGGGAGGSRCCCTGADARRCWWSSSRCCHARSGFHLGARARRASDRDIRARHDNAQLGAGRWLEAGHECGVPMGSAGLRRHAPPYRSARYTTAWLRARGLLPRRTLGIRIFALRFLFRIQGPSTPGSQGGTLGRAARRRRILHFARKHAVRISCPTTSAARSSSGSSHWRRIRCGGLPIRYRG